jgi:hypothetical protein
MNLRSRLTTHSDTVAARKRDKRWAHFIATFPDLYRMTVLDLGGTVSSWQHAPVQPLHVHCINPWEDEVTEGRITSEQEDACVPLAWKSRRQVYDLVYSNSVIEHVGGHRMRMRFAEVVRNKAVRHWVQTPYRYFPVEPHVMAPMIQFLPLAARAKFAEYWPLHTTPHDFRDSVVTQMNTELLDITLMRLYFPGSQIHYERMAGLVKSITAVQA